MKLDWATRTLSLSVGELARFSLALLPHEGSGRWRAELGTYWHAVLQKRLQAEESDWLFEHAVNGNLAQAGWHFNLKGRIDQLNHTRNPILLREIKTISDPLPADASLLRERYPHYFHQAMLYAFLLGRSKRFPRTELVFLEVATGITQTVLLDEADYNALHRHLSSVVEVLEERRSHFNRIKSFAIPEPFSNWRDGQLAARRDLAVAMSASQSIFFEAPTGFGKTGLALEQSLRVLATGEVDRIILLTSKNTGHLPLLEQLNIFKEECPALSVCSLRSRKDHAIDTALEKTITPDEMLERWKSSSLSAPALLAEAIPDLDKIKRLGQELGIPPWAITRILLPYADVWVADFNYLFDPAVSRSIDLIPTYDPSRTLLLIDEAHNLPDRVAHSYSYQLKSSTIEQILTEAQLSRFPTALTNSLQDLLRRLDKQTPTDELSPAQANDFIEAIIHVHKAFLESSFSPDELSAESQEWIWELPYLIGNYQNPELSFQSACPTAGVLVFNCLDAAPVIAPVLEQFHKTIFMSATLQPIETFAQALGLSTNTDITIVNGTAPWLEGCFDIIVDARVDTRYQKRAEYYDTTTHTIGQSALNAKGCSIVFFPSYRYAEQILERIGFHYPTLRCRIQPKDLSLEDQIAFLKSALLVEDVLFLILGSRFSEGIDVLGGKVQQAIVVSPALPEVNSLQKARQSLYQGSPQDAFQSVFLIPGLRKISQALGRLVRDPDHRVRILLHGKRFMEPQYQDLLPSYLRPIDWIITDEAFEKKWLSKNL